MSEITFMMMIILSILFIYLNHPLSMGLMLLIQTMMVAMITGTMNLNFWYSYILFLIMIGGMLILFMYMTSIASNEKFKFSMKLSYFFIVSFIIMMLMSLIDQYYLSFLMKNSNMWMLNPELKTNISMMKYLNFPNSFIMFMMINYLFISLIAIVKITDYSVGPLRQKF